MEEDLNKTIGSHWSRVTERRTSDKPLKRRWWQSQHIIRHINKLVCGEEVSGFSQGLIELLRERAAHLVPFEKAISVGCGNGKKEINLIRQGLVHSFELFELSERRISLGKEWARQQSVEENVRFIHGDALSLVSEPEQYDLVHWNNSLHHMMDVDKAVEWSRKVLKPGGLFYMDDFIGASRFQWPDRQIEIASRVRSIFESSKYLTNPQKSDSSLPVKVRRPNLAKLIESDPSEAADSERIVEAIHKYFPNVEFKATGGVVYHLTLNDMLNNFDEREDKILLDLLLLIDELCTHLGQTHYGTALAFKEG